MKYRTTVLLEQATMERLRTAARYRGTSVTALIHEAVDEYVVSRAANPGLLRLVGAGASLPVAEGDGEADELADAIYRDAMGDAGGPAG
jgi:hypothetical protein